MSTESEVCSKCGREHHSKDHRQICPRCLMSVAMGDEDDLDSLNDLDDEEERYEKGERIGEGGSAEVHRLTDHRLGRSVAIKTIKSEDPNLRDRFIEEARVMSRLEHPNIAPIHDLKLDENGRPSYTMKYISGQTLQQTLESQSLGEITVSLEIFNKVCDAMAFAHSHEVIHRDLKPENIMIGEYGEVWVMDWGLAKHRQMEESEGTATITQESSAENMPTLFGKVMGTPQYMSPEQANGLIRDIDHRSDVFALGAILYQILTHQPPHQGESIEEILENARAGVDRAKLLSTAESAWNKSSPILGSRRSTLLNIALKAMSTAPDERYQSVLELQQDLKSYLGGFTTTVDRPDPLIRAWMLIKRRKRESSIIAVALLLFIGVSFWFTTRQQRIQQDLDQLSHRIEIDNQRDWKLVFSDDFSDHDFLKRWKLYTEKDTRAGVVNGRLHLSGKGSRTLHLREKIPGDLRLSFDCKQEGDFLCDISPFMNAPAHYAGMTKGYPSGYLFMFGGFNNQLTALVRHDPVTKHASHLGISRENRVSSGRVYRVVAQKKQGNFKLWVDEKLLIDVDDIHADNLQDQPGIGIFSFGSTISYDNVKIYRLGEPRKADMVDMADRLYFSGQSDLARDMYLQLSRNYNDEEILRRIKRGLERCDIAKYRDRLKKAGLKKFVYTLAARRKFLLKIQDPELNGLPEELRDIPLDQLILDGTSIEKLESLKDMKLEHLSLQGTLVEDISALKGMKIESLNLSNTRVVDFSPLKSLPLKKLYLANTKITNIEMLKGKGLEALVLKKTHVNDLAPLKGMPLEVLVLEDCPVTKLDPLRGSSLRHLDIRNTRVTDLTPLSGATLEVLLMSRTKVANIDALAGMSLSELDARTTSIEDIAPLQGHKLLKLNLGQTRVENLRPLLGAPIIFLTLDRTPIRSLDGLQGMPLHELTLSHTKVEDLMPLSKSPVSYLLAGDTEISDITPLKDKPLYHVYLQNTQVNDLSPLSGCKTLLALDIRMTRIKDLSPLKGMSIHTLNFSADRLASGYRKILSSLPKLKRIHSE